MVCRVPEQQQACSRDQVPALPACTCHRPDLAFPPVHHLGASKHSLNTSRNLTFSASGQRNNRCSNHGIQQPLSASSSSIVAAPQLLAPVATLDSFAKKHPPVRTNPGAISRERSQSAWLKHCLRDPSSCPTRPIRGGGLRDHGSLLFWAVSKTMGDFLCNVIYNHKGLQF